MGSLPSPLEKSSRATDRSALNGSGERRACSNASSNVMGSTRFPRPGFHFPPKPLSLGHGTLVLCQGHGPGRFHKTVTRFGRVGTVAEVRTKVRVADGPYRVLAFPPSRGGRRKCGRFSG